ncbi:hypothetical protein HF272_13715 [Rhizobium leguminosarum]|uniref:hypothetical protein n=1 Tax=Rhizobium leguminosarum TaxID=384 RepID=UPI001C8FD1F4|nr:hypothetical protein [Rhizobium leguminosarum]MBY2992487.1 hypothetical protein [Rhizobium leguminosarum]
MIDIKHYLPPGPIGAAFLKSRGPIDVIMGPGGSGKTAVSVVKGPMHAAEYMPVCRDGWVRVKTLCVRDTYRSFARTALASWYNTFPEKHPWTVSHEGGQDRPVVHKLCWEAWRGPDKVNVEYVMETGAIGDNDLEAFAKGYEISMAWGNEYDLMPENTLPLFFQRCGRYPPVGMIAPAELERVSRDGREAMKLMGLTFADNEPVLPRIVFGDLNPPDYDHPAYSTPFNETAKPGGIYHGHTPGWNGFWQPSGLSPNAENRIGKPRSSYELEAATTKDKALVRRMVHSLPAYAKDGTPVYADYFNPEVHKADQTITAVPRFGLTIGIDAGGSPAATFGQISPSGQNRLLAELVADPGTGPTRFGKAMLALLTTRFPGIPILSAWADPSAWYGADTNTGEFHWINTLTAIVGFPIMPAPTNEPSIRQEAVKHYLSTMIDGVTPGYIVDPSCRKMIGGYEAHYKFTKKTSSSETDKGEAVKNEYSHPHDAEQYRCLGHLGLTALITTAVQQTTPSGLAALQSGRQPRQVEARRSPGDFDVWNV